MPCQMISVSGTGGGSYAYRPPSLSDTFFSVFVFPMSHGVGD